MNTSGSAEGITVWLLFRRWWWVLILATAIAGVVGYAAARVLPKSYDSTATVLVGPVNTDISLDASGSLTATYESLATSQPVLARAIAATHAPLTPNQLENEVTTTSNSVSRLVTITVANRDPVLAAHIANAIAGRLRVLAQHSTTATNEAVAAFDQAPQVTALTDAQRNAVEFALKTVLGPSPAGQVTVVNPAVPATSPSSPKKSLFAVLGAMAGLLIASLILLGRMSGKAAPSVERVQPPVERAHLGVVDITPSRDTGEAVAAEKPPDSSVAADYRSLAAKLDLADSPPRSLLVVDSSDGSAAAVVAANLAAALSQAAERSIMLADVSTEGMALTRLLGLQGRHGYAELLAVDDLETLNGSLDEMLIHRGDRVVVLPGGRRDATKPVSQERVASLLRRLKGSAELVVLSGPSMSRSPSGLNWARGADSALFVVDDDRTSTEDVTRATSDLSVANADFLGTVVGRRRMALPALARRMIPSRD